MTRFVCRDLQRCVPPLPGHQLLQRRLCLEVLGRIPPHELQRLVHLVIGRGDTHQGTPAVDDLGIRLGFVRRDPERDQRGRLAQLAGPTSMFTPHAAATSISLTEVSSRFAMIVMSYWMPCATNVLVRWPRKTRQTDQLRSLS